MLRSARILRWPYAGAPAAKIVRKCLLCDLAVGEASIPCDYGRGIHDAGE